MKEDTLTKDKKRNKPCLNTFCAYYCFSTTHFLK